MRALSVLLLVMLGAAAGCQKVQHSAGAAAAPGPDVSLAADRLDVLRAGQADAGFVRAGAPHVFEFPKDHGPHPQFRQEWWYFTGRLRAQDGKQFGFELTFFRVGIVPPDAAPATAPSPAPSAPSRWRARQIYVAHFAVTNIGAGTFHSQARYARGALGLAGAQAPPLHVWVDDWSLIEGPPPQRHGAGPLSGPAMLPGQALGASGGQRFGASPGQALGASGGQRFGASPGQGLGASGGQRLGASPGEVLAPPPQWSLHAADAGYRLDLQVRPEGPPVLNGAGGLSRKGNGVGEASYYYSIPRLATRGTLTVDGKALAVTGTTWLDREWGSGALSANQEGWDWFSLQLSDGSAFMFYALRDRGGIRDVHSAGTWVDSAGKVRGLSSADVSIGVERYWTSPHGDRYPAAWSIRVGSAGLALEIHPVIADQELRTQPPYWEGAVDARGTLAGRPVSAQGYVELVGYAR